MWGVEGICEGVEGVVETCEGRGTAKWNRI